MRRIFVSVLLLGFAILLHGCSDDEEPCGTYRLTTQVDLLGQAGGDEVFSYNADGSLQKVSGRNQTEANFFYNADGHLIRIEQNIEGMPKTAWLFAADSKGRVISRYRDDPFPGDSLIFEYDDSDRIVKVSSYWTRAEVFFYFDIEYPDATTVKKTVYLRGQYTPELALSVLHIYKTDNHSRPHPKEYYFWQDPIEQIFLSHNLVSKRMTGASGITIGPVTTHTYTYNGRGYPSSQDYGFKYKYACE